MTRARLLVALAYGVALAVAVGVARRIDLEQPLAIALAVVGPLAITAMFRWVSLPWLERRMKERRPGYSAWAERSSLVLPGRARQG